MTRSALSLNLKLEKSHRETQRHAFLKHHAQGLTALPSDALEVIKLEAGRNL